MKGRRSNPYDWKFPVRDSQLFAGRTDELGLIEDEISRLTDERPVSPVLAIIGERKVGKTSLLLRIQEMCSTHSIICANVPIQDTIAADAWEFWHEVFSQLLMAVVKAGATIEGGDTGGAGFGFLTPAMSRQMHSDRPVLSTEDLWFSRAYGAHISGTVQSFPAVHMIAKELGEIINCSSRLGRRAVLLMFDEAQRFPSPGVVIQQLRHVFQNQDRCGIIFSGEPSLERLFNDPTADFYEHAKIVPIRNFTNHMDVMKCALLPLDDEEKVLMSPMTIDHLARLSQGKPNQIRLMCDTIYRRYAAGSQKDLSITRDALDDVIDEVATDYQDPELRKRLDRIRMLPSVDLEILHNITRYPNWSVEDVVGLDESFRGEAHSPGAYQRRLDYIHRRRNEFVQMGLISDVPEALALVGGEFVHLYVRFLYEVRKYGQLAKALILGKGPPTPFGEITEKLAKSIAYSLGQMPEMTRFVVHSYYRDEGDILETIQHRFASLQRIMARESNALEEAAEIVADCFSTCQLVKKEGVFYLLVVSVRSQKDPRDNTHIEIYFSHSERRAEPDLTSLVKIVSQQAAQAGVNLENYGGMIVSLPKLDDLLSKMVGAGLDDLLPKLDPISRWQLASVRHAVDSQDTEEDEAEDKQMEDAKWQTLYGSGKSTEAEECIEQLLSGAPRRSNRATLLNDLGYMKYRAGGDKVAGARKDLEESLRLHSSDVSITLLNLAVIDIDDGDYPTVVKRLEDALALITTLRETHAAYLRYRLPENHLNFKVNWELHPPANRIEAAYINLAYATLKISGSEKAESVLNEAQSLIPSSLRLKHAFARLYLHRKDAQPAIPIYKELDELPRLPDPGMASEITVFSHRIHRTPKKKRR